VASSSTIHEPTAVQSLLELCSWFLVFVNFLLPIAQSFLRNTLAFCHLSDKQVDSNKMYLLVKFAAKKNQGRAAARLSVYEVVCTEYTVGLYNLSLVKRQSNWLMLPRVFYQPSLSNSPSPT